MKGLLELLPLIAVASSASAQDLLVNGLGATPQMGWDDWNTFGCAVSADLMIETATVIATTGLKDVGYKYVVMDDCWSELQRASNGTIVANSTRFPNGIQNVANQIHDMGLYWGMYSSAGTETCAGYPGSLGYETIDADTFASWGVDYLKYDNCYNQGLSGNSAVSYNRYKAMGDALNATGRPIYYSLCSWGEDAVYSWGKNISNSWRMSGDIYDSFDVPNASCPCTDQTYLFCPSTGYDCSFLNILDKAALISEGGSPGGWNDLDMLEVGHGKSTDDEYMMHFSMWAAVKSPLIMGNDVRNMTAETFSILSNPAVIAINQDPLGQPANRVWRYYLDDPDQNGQGQISLWSGMLGNGDQVIALINGGTKSMVMKATLENIFSGQSVMGPTSKIDQAWDIYDLWGDRLSDEVASNIMSGTASPGKYLYNVTQTSYAEGLTNNNPMLFGKKIGTVQSEGTVTANVPAHGIAFYRLRPSS